MKKSKIENPEVEEEIEKIVFSEKVNRRKKKVVKSKAKKFAKKKAAKKKAARKR